jgi:hypothetical protein
LTRLPGDLEDVGWEIGAPVWGYFSWCI